MSELSSPDFTFCADSYSVSAPSPCYRSGRKKTPVILPEMQVAGYTSTSIQPSLNKVRVGWLCCLGIAWKPIRETSSKATHQRTLDHSCLILLSHCGLILAWSVELVCTHTHKNAAREWIIEPSPKILSREEKATIDDVEINTRELP